MQKSKQYVIIKIFPTRDIIAFLLLFISILILIFPEGKLEEILFSSEEVNIDLSIKYLEALSKFKKSPKFLRALAMKYIKKGEYDKASSTLKRLEQEFPDEEIEILKTKYEILKGIFFLRKEKENVKLKKEIENILSEILKKVDNLQDFKWIFKEGISVNIPSVVLSSASKIIASSQDDEERKNYIKKVIEYALWIQNYKLAKTLISIYATSYTNDEEFTKFILKSALFTGDTEFAAEIASRILSKIGGN